MLVLARKVGQSILIGDDIKLTIVRVAKNGEVKLAFTAPKNIRIMREEIANVSRR